jgi:hypothetical protein
VLQAISHLLPVTVALVVAVVAALLGAVLVVDIQVAEEAIVVLILA